MKNPALSAVVLGIPLALYALLLAQPVNLVTADLGRHLKNGEVTLETLTLPRVNLYAYTFPDYPAINHHWLSGVIFYLVWKFSGFVGLHLFYMAAAAAAFFIFLRLARRRGGAGLAALTGVAVLPLLLSRSEIRPEIFSYLLAGVFLRLMTEFRNGEIGWKKLLILPALQIIWTNLHIYFFLGPVIAGVFFMEALISTPLLKLSRAGSKNKPAPSPGLVRGPAAKKLGLILLALIAAVFVNPYSYKGALMPLTIFQNFGYRLVENQPIWFIENLLPNNNYLVFKILFALLLTSFAVKKLSGGRLNWVDLILALGFSAAAWLAIRNFALFGLFAVPIIAANLKRFSRHLETPQTHLIIIIAGLMTVGVVFSGEIQKINPRWARPALGLEPNNLAALEFIRANNIAGPIFNNYDIGSYLIFGLYEQRKRNDPIPNPQPPTSVFVDNRPEAYPAEFFQKTYIPMQADDNIWREQLNIYGFKTIVFSHNDYTPWGQRFLSNRLKDPAWQVVFKDGRVIILTRNDL